MAKKKQIRSKPRSPASGTGNFLIDGLPAESLSELLPHLESVDLADNTQIARPDEFQPRLYFPVLSVVSEYQILKDGKTVEVAMTGREGIVGIHAVLSKQPSPNFSEVLVPGPAYAVDSALFRELIDSLPRLQKRIFDYQGYYFSQMSQRVICSTYHSIEQRLCLWMLMIHDRTGLKDLKFTQEQIGCVLGVQRPSVTFITQSLRDEKLIDYNRGEIRLLDLVKLRAASCNCFEELRISEL